MTENFTPTNQKVVSHLVQIKKAKQIKKFWTIDGKHPKHRVTSIENVSHMLSAAINEGYVADPDQSQSLLTFQPMQQHTTIRGCHILDAHFHYDYLRTATVLEMLP